MADHSRFNPGNDDHAVSGVSIARTNRVIHLFRLREGRRFTSAQVYRHQNAIRAWVYRYWGRRAERGETVYVPDVDSLRIQHQMAEGSTNTLVATYVVTTGWQPGFVCYAASLGRGEAGAPDLGVIIASVLSQRAGDQYEEEESHGLPN